MTPQDEYLEQVRRAMAGMEPSVRDDILRELRSHIAESTAANGGDTATSLLALGDAREVGRHYRDLYGYGRGSKVLFAAVAFLLAIPSVPVLVVGAQGLLPYALSIPFLVAVAAWILWVSVVAGSRTGVIAGLAAMASRFATFGLAVGFQPGPVTSSIGLGLMVIVSVALVLLGWMPGTAKKVWSGPRGEL